MSRLCECPRCGDMSLEKLKTYSHCSNCLYVEDSWSSPEAAYLKAMKDAAEIETRHQQKTKILEKEKDKNCA